MMTPGSSVTLLTADQVVDVLKVATAGLCWTGERRWVLDRVQVGMQLRTVPARLPATGDAARRLRIACGAVLLNLRVALRAMGVAAVVRLLPDPARPDIQAVVRTIDSSPASSADLALGAQQSSGASTTRPRAVADRLISHTLTQAARLEGGWLAMLPDLPPAQVDGRRTSTRRLVAVIGTLEDGPLAHLQAGQAVQRVVLTAMTLGLVAALEPTILDTALGRGQLRERLGGALWPQIALRLTSDQH